MTKLRKTAEVNMPEKNKKPTMAPLTEAPLGQRAKIDELFQRMRVDDGHLAQLLNLQEWELDLHFG